MKYILIAILFFILGALFGCAPMLSPIDAPLAVYCDGCHADLMEDMINGWNDSQGYELLYESDNRLDADIVITLVPYRPNDCGGYTYHGDPCEIEVHDMEESWQLLSHEVGHCFGLGHVPEEKYLMHKIVPTDPVFPDL